MAEIPIEDRQWNQKQGEYPTLKNGHELLDLNLDAKGLFQIEGNDYPVFPHLKELVNVLTEPLPSGVFTLNANDDYPYPKFNHLETLIPVLSEPLPAGIFILNTDEDYPKFTHLETLVPVLSDPLPTGIFTLNTVSYPKFDHLETLIPILTKPYPQGIFISDDENDYPFMTHINDVIPILTKPYPEGIFIGDSEHSYPYMTHLNLVPLGICYFTENLSEVDIPSTMETISNYSFFGTSITEIELPEGCTFYRHSFPENTSIKEVSENGQ